MPIYIAMDISIKNIFNTDALKGYMWFLLCHYPINIYIERGYYTVART